MKLFATTRSWSSIVGIIEPVGITYGWITNVLIPLARRNASPTMSTSSASHRANETGSSRWLLVSAALAGSISSAGLLTMGQLRSVDYLLCKRAFFVRQAGPRDQIRTPLGRSANRLHPAPRGDAGVIAARQDLRHIHSVERRRTRVLRILQQPIAERLVDYGLLVAEHSRLKPGNGVGDE